MDIVMLQTISGESINAGRTTQEFLKGATYPVPDEIGRLWIGRGWAQATTAAAAAPVARTSTRKE